MPPKRGKVKKRNKGEEDALLLEQKRKEEEERAREEARLAAEAEEKAKADAEVKEHLSTPEGKLHDLFKWLKSIPLSKKFSKRIDRDFSDGVLVAEIISHYCPDLCDHRQFFPWYSKENKYSNWHALNKKCFPELGFTLKDTDISNVIQPWGCGKKCTNELLIYTVLDSIRNGIAENNPSVYDYRKDPEYKNTEIIFEKEEKVFKRTPRVDLNVSPPYSKIEIQIAQGIWKCTHQFERVCDEQVLPKKCELADCQDIPECTKEEDCKT